MGRLKLLSILCLLAFTLCACGAEDPRAKNNWPPPPSMKDTITEVQADADATDRGDVAVADLN